MVLVGENLSKKTRLRSRMAAAAITQMPQCVRNTK